MNKIDFPIELLIGDTVEQTFKIAVRISDSAMPDDTERLRDLLNAFANVAGGGGFSRVGVNPSNSIVEATEIMLQDASLLEYVWKAVNLDWRFIYVLRNSLRVFSQIHVPLQSLYIIDITEGAKPIQKTLVPLTGYLQDELYPEISSVLGFQVVFEDRRTDNQYGNQYGTGIF